MQRSFILPPSMGTQRQRKRTRPSPVSKKSDGSSSFVAPDRLPPLLTTGLQSRPRVITDHSAGQSDSRWSLQRQPPKRKLDDVQPDHDNTGTQLTNREAGQSNNRYPQPDINVHQSFSSTSAADESSSAQFIQYSDALYDGSPTALIPPPRTPPQTSRVGLARSLEDRKKMSVSQVSKQLFVVPGRNTQRSRHSSSYPVLADMIPSQLRQLRTSDVSKNLKLSEVARRIVLPPVNISAPISRSKKKAMFIPPLVRGGYAERLANLMSYHKSEYTIWANATLRADKGFGSTDPLAVVEVVAISKDHRLQWTRCRVVVSENNKPPFDVSADTVQQISDHGACMSPRIPLDTIPINIDVVRSTPSQGIAPSSAPRDTSLLYDEDSIDGLHADMGNMGVSLLSSSQGSGFEGSIGEFMKTQKRWHSQDDSMLDAIDEEAQTALQFLRSSQGSDEGADEYNDLFVRREVGMERHARGKPEARELLQLSCINNLEMRANPVLIEEINEEEAMVLDGDDGLRRTASASSTIDSRSSDSGAEREVASASACRMESALNRTQEEPRLEPNFIIIFSSLFSRMPLKVADKVEVHEPCRKIIIPQFGPSTSGSAIWIAERYKVVLA